MTDMIWWIGIGLAVIAGLVIALIVISFFSTWLKGTFSKCIHVGFGNACGNAVKGSSGWINCGCRITAEKASLPLTTDQLKLII